MKHIFKKLHHHPNRSNETPQQSSTASSSSSASSSSCAVPDQRTSVPGQNSGAPPLSPSTTSPSSATVAPVSSPVPTRQQQQPDYITSEEEYQVQLALALSVSASSGQDSSIADVNSDHHQILSASQLDDGDADSQSRQYWDYGVLDYKETIKDGFYDVCCKNPEIKEMPSLTDLETNTKGSDFEVVIVNCKIDPGLEELMDVARCIAIDCPATEISLLVQRLAELVTDQMGGRVRDANVLKARWTERSSELRTSRHTTVLPIGALQIGLTRHRALLFKVLADKVGIPCRVLRGRQYIGNEEDAVNVIKLPNESEFLVDLMGEPGTLIPADIQSTKDASSFKTYHPKLSKLPSLQAINDSRITYSKPNSLSEQNSGGGNSVPSRKDSEKVESLPSISGASMSAGVSSSVFNKRVPTANQIDHTPSLAIGSSLYKGGCGPNVAGDGARVNVNPVPYNQNNSEDPKYLFADLNPFQIKGYGRAPLQGNQPAKKVDESYQVKDSLVTGRPPVPLLWKSTHVYNEVPKKNEYDFVESLFTENNDPAVGCNVPSIPSTSSATPGKVSAEVFKLPNKSDNTYGGYGGNGGNASTGNSSLVAAAEGAFNRLSLEDNQSTRRETYSWDWEVQQNDESNVVKDYGKNMLDNKNNKQVGFAGTNLKLKDQENPSSSADPHVDPMIDDVSDCEIPWEDLVIGERIGLGSYGEVYHADWNGTEVAVKKFLDQDFSGAALAEFRREVRIMQRLRHRNVVLFVGAVTRPPNLSIITEFLPRGSLYRIIHRPHCQIDEKRRIKMAFDVAEGMNCLHTSKPTIVHRDLKSPNLLVDKNWNVKVGDFGLSRLKHNTFLSSKSTAGTPEWMAPEVLRNEPSNEKCDVYSFGVILWELATLKLPWSGMNPMQVVGAVGFQNRRLDIPKEVDPLVARIIWECWQTDPNLRPSFAQLTVALKPLQRLVIPSHIDQPSTPLPQEISVDSTP